MINETIKEKEKCIFIENVMDEWLAYSRNYIKISTYQKYDSVIENHIKPRIGKISISHFNSDMVNEFISTLLERGNLNTKQNLSIKTVNDILIVLDMGLNYASEKYLIHAPKIKLLRKKYQEMKVLSYSEQKQLEEYLLKDIDIYKFGVLLALYTGLRIGELCALQWEDIKNGNLIVNKTMLRIKDGDKTKIIITEPKTNSSNRIIPLSNAIASIVETFKRDNGYVLCGKKGKFVEPRLMQIRFKKIIEEAGLSDINFHALRHSFATRCVEANFEIKSLSEILGHSNIKTTLNLYVHSSFELKQKNMNKLELLNNI